MPRTISCFDLALNFAAQGLRVLWADHHVEIAEIVRSLDGADERFAKVCKANGRERVSLHSGGEIYFVAPRGKGYRGVSADVLFVDLETYQNKDRLVDLMPSLNASQRTHVNGEPNVVVLPGRPRLNVA